MGAESIEKEKSVVCSYCEKRRALLYCRADAAALCLECDRHVHAANTVSSKHPRSLLCDSCRSSPSSIFVPSSCSLLCSNCDHSERHLSRRPLEPFSGCPSAAELAALLGAGGDALKEKEKEIDDDDDDVDRFFSFVEEDVEVVRMDDLLIGPTASFEASDAIMTGHPPAKDPDFLCGKQKEEILRQLRELAMTESLAAPARDFRSVVVVPVVQENVREDDHNHDEFFFDFNGDATTFTDVPNDQDKELMWTHNDWHEEASPVYCNVQQMGSSSSTVVPFSDEVDGIHTNADFASVNDKHKGNDNISLPLKVAHELMVLPDRDTVISRYKEKRKMRRYDKLIRYESRKARADSRVRVKGRFAKVNHVPNF